MTPSPATFDQVLQLARQLPLDEWAATDEEDDGDEPWDDMLRALDQHHESARTLYPYMNAEVPESAP